MHVLFPAALDHAQCDPAVCDCRRWLALAAKGAGGKRRRRVQKSGQVAFPFRHVEQALLAALVENDAAPSEPKNGAFPSPFADFPTFAWATPLGAEVGFSTLCGSVRDRLAHTDEPVALATADGGWRRELQLFRHADGLENVRLSPRIEFPFAEYADLRDVSLDLIAERRYPLLARLSQVATLLQVVLRDRAMPAELPSLTARSFLSFRGFLESRVAAAEAAAMAGFAQTALPLFARSLGLGDGAGLALAEALRGEWRDDLQRHVVPVERDLWAPVEAWMGTVIFGLPLARDVSLTRGSAELFEGFAAGLRYAAAVGAVQRGPLSPAQMVAALALGEHFVSWSASPLPTYALPPESHDRGPRMADLDMTLASIC